VFGEDQVTTGASNDIQQVASIARRMVAEWGMSDVIGQMALTSPGGQQPFMGRDQQASPPRWSAETLEDVDKEVNRLVGNAYATAKRVLSENRELMEVLAKRLVETETVTAEEFQMMISEHGREMAPYEVFGEAKPAGDLPFQVQPVSV